MHECWESLGPETLGSIREAEGIPQDATTASVSLDGVMVPLRPGEDGRAKASWREAACGTVSFHDAEGKRLKTLYLGRMPESGKLTLKAQLASEVAHIRRARPEIGIVAIADGAADNWTFLETLSPETEVIDFWHACEHLQTASDHAVAPGWFEKYREILRHDPRGVATANHGDRALRHLRDGSLEILRADVERMEAGTVRDRLIEAFDEAVAERWLSNWRQIEVMADRGEICLVQLRANKPT